MNIKISEDQIICKINLIKQTHKINLWENEITNFNKLQLLHQLESMHREKNKQIL
jgi:hypothetical protein